MKNIIFRQTGKDDYYKIWHTSDKNIFILVHSGEGSIVLREKSYPLTKGALCFIGAGKYHYTFPKEPTLYTRTKLLIDSPALQRLTSALGTCPDFHMLFNEDSTAFSILSGNEYDRAEKLFERLNEMNENGNIIEADILAASIELMIILAKNVTAETQTSLDPLQKAIRYINSHISEDITIDGISDACYISKYYLCRSFKKKMGLTIMEYILQTRLTMAKELLKKEYMPITQISLTCGFSSPSYFSRVFKEKTGVSPIKYKATHI